MNASPRGPKTLKPRIQRGFFHFFVEFTLTVLAPKS